MNSKFFDVKKDKQDEMINAALKTFAIKGYKDASTDVIVKEAGISKGLLFHYFTSKQGLYDFICDYSRTDKHGKKERKGSVFACFPDQPGKSQGNEKLSFYGKISKEP